MAFGFGNTGIPQRNGSNGAADGKLAMDASNYQDLKSALHRQLLSRLDLEKVTSYQDARARSQVASVILEQMNALGTPLSAAEKERLGREVLHEVFGLGPLEPLLQEPGITDILVNTHRCVYIERAGVLEKTDVVFKDEAHLRTIIDKIVSGVGRRVDESCPMCDARLPDGSRVNVVIPPLAIDGPILSVRRFGKKALSVDELLNTKSITPAMLELLMGAVKARLNVVVSGGTGAGKTTLLNMLSNFINPSERIVTIESSAELQLQQEHVVRLECRPPNVEGKGSISQRELVINALRMRPDRIVVGEARAEEAFDMLQAMNTGHDGSLTTVHANSPRDALARLEMMSMMANLNIADRAIRQLIASAVNLVVQVSRMSDGTRRVTHISEVTGIADETVTIQDIFTFEKRGIGLNGKVLGRYSATGIRPKFAEKLRTSGINLGNHIFEHSMEV